MSDIYIYVNMYIISIIIYWHYILCDRYAYIYICRCVIKLNGPQMGQMGDFPEQTVKLLPESDLKRILRAVASPNAKSRTW